MAAPRTVGVEEELLLLDGSGTALAAEGAELADRLGERSTGQFDHELQRQMVELASRPHTALIDLEQELGARRRELAAAAGRAGRRIAAVGTSPVDDQVLLTSDPRYAEMSRRYGLLARDVLTCGMHVHVGIGSDEEGVAVADRLRPWLNVLIALSANSPFAGGSDTAYASYRTVLWGRWPTASPTEAFGDLAGYRRTRAALLASGAAMDDGMLYFEARLSARYPTLELRAADVCLRVEDAVTLAGVARAMVVTAAEDHDQRRPLPAVRAELSQAARWRAAREGLDGFLVDPVSGEPVPAADRVGQLLDWVGPALASSGDAERVTSGVATILGRGNGARQQRIELARTGSFDDLLSYAAAATTA
jgi:carboxylate-amine ligase